MFFLALTTSVASANGYDPVAGVDGDLSKLLYGKLVEAKFTQIQGPKSTTVTGKITCIENLQKDAVGSQNQTYYCEIVQQ